MASNRKLPPRTPAQPTAETKKKNVKKTIKDGCQSLVGVTGFTLSFLTECTAHGKHTVISSGHVHSVTTGSAHDSPENEPIWTDILWPVFSFWHDPIKITKGKLSVVLPPKEETPKEFLLLLLNF
jgi:hypothetical protein